MFSKNGLIWYNNNRLFYTLKYMPILFLNHWRHHYCTCHSVFSKPVDHVELIFIDLHVLQILDEWAALYMQNRVVQLHVNADLMELRQAPLEVIVFLIALLL